MKNNCSKRWLNYFRLNHQHRRAYRNKAHTKEWSNRQLKNERIDSDEPGMKFQIWFYYDRQLINITNSVNWFQSLNCLKSEWSSTKLANFLSIFDRFNFFFAFLLIDLKMLVISWLNPIEYKWDPIENEIWNVRMV